MKKVVKNLISGHTPTYRDYLIERALEGSGGNINSAAKKLQFDPSNFRRLLRKISYPGYPHFTVKTQSKDNLGTGSETHPR